MRPARRPTTAAALLDGLVFSWKSLAPVAVLSCPVARVTLPKRTPGDCVKLSWRLSGESRATGLPLQTSNYQHAPSLGDSLVFMLSIHPGSACSRTSVTSWEGPSLVRRGGERHGAGTWPRGQGRDLRPVSTRGPPGGLRANHDSWAIYDFVPPSPPCWLSKL